jgi:phenylpropionate dioxygenase-like ring-hydroxylating dioxygenase large terminal subunit
MSDSSASLKNVPFPVTDKERIPVQRYYDEEFYRLECERIWPHVWQMACRLDEIPKVGDWVEYQILEKSVIVVRTRSGIKAFHNACRHRGMLLASGHGNCSKTGFICPFHGWRFNMEGDCTFVFGRKMFSEDVLAKAALALAPCRLETWGGSAFINFDDKAPPLLECLGPITERLGARNIDKLKVDAWRSTVLPVNWKLAMEAFMEGYHSMGTHPQLYAIAPTESNGAALHPSADQSATRPRLTAREMIDDMVRLIAMLHEGMGGMVTQEEVAIAEDLREMELPEEPFTALGAYFGRFNDAVTADGRKRGLPIFDLNQVAATHKFYGVEFIFPHFFVLPQFSAMAAYRIRPLGAESCLFEIWALSLHPENEERERPVAPVPIPCDDPRISKSCGSRKTWKE